MMALIKELINYDKVSFASWFSRERVSKIIVLFLFFVTFFGFSLVLYSVSSTFFKYVFTLEDYGQFTSGYIIKASVIVVLWLGILSSMISTLTFLLTPDRRLDYLFVLPIDPRGIITYQTIKTFFLNLVIYLVLLSPLLLAYLNNLGISSLAIFLRLALLLLLITFISESLGTSFGFITANRFKKKEGTVFVLFTALIMVALTIALFKLIFPDQLHALYQASTEDFATLYAQLPLNKYCAINNNLSFLITNGPSISSVYLILFTAFLTFIAYQIQKHLFVETWQQVRVNQDHHIFVFKLFPKSLKYPSLFQKDALSILRSPREVGYGLFLFVLLIAFTGLFSRGVEVNRIPQRFTPSVIVFTWFWLAFYATTYFMRICFPSMSKEGKTRWWLFTMPISPKTILSSKIFTSLVFTIPIFLITVIQWWFAPYQINALFFSLVSLVSIATISIINTTLGIARPDYSLPDDPDKVSTGISGMFSLTISIIFGLLTGYLFYRTLQGGLSEINAIYLQIMLSLFVGSLLYFLSLSSLKHHSLDIK